VPKQITCTQGGNNYNPKIIKYTAVDLYAFLVQVYLQNTCQLHLSFYWLPEAHYYVIIILTFVDFGLPDVYKEEINIFSNKLASILLQNFKYNYAIDLEEGKTLLQMPLYNLLQKELQILQKYLKSAFKKGWIKPSKLLAGVPILFVLKADGIMRLYINYKCLNKITIKNWYPLLLVSKLFDRFSHVKIFTKLDFYNVYHGIHIKKGDEWKTIFKTYYSHFKYLVIPFSLTNAFITF